MYEHKFNTFPDEWDRLLSVHSNTFDDVVCEKQTDGSKDASSTTSSKCRQAQINRFP